MAPEPTTAEQLARWLEEPEGTRFEFKEAKQRFDFEKLVEYCVALANEEGGKILFGATDKRPRKIVGTAAFDEPGRTEAGLYQRLARRIPVEEVRVPEGRVVVVHVPSRLPGTAWEIDGRFLKRAGDELTSLTSDELRAIYAETGPDFSAEVCPEASASDLSSAAIGEFRERWAKKSRDERRSSWSDAETLENAELTVDGRVTYAALILFGTREALGRRLANAEIVFEYRSSEASGPAADREEYRVGFFLCHDSLWSRINLRNDRQTYQDGLFRMDLPTFDEESVREALLNAVAHRDYRLGGSVFVRQYGRRLEIVSPGGLPPGVTTENILDQQNPRNRRLAEAFAKCGMIDRSGQGMNLMFENAIRQGKSLPSFAGTSAHEVRLTLEGTVNDPGFVRFIEQVGQERLRSFSTYDFLTLDFLHREKPLTASMTARLPGLVEAGVVESVGRGKGTRYLLSERFHAALGQRGRYSRKRGLDRETNKALLLKHIERFAETGTQMTELKQVLPALSRNQIQGLLRELAQDGLVHVRGATRSARWFPGKPPADCV